jgi:hypothetical protein
VNSRLEAVAAARHWDAEQSTSAGS